MPDSQRAAEAAAAASAAASAATKTMYAGSGGMVVSWFFSSEFGILVGLIVGLGGFLTNWYYRAQENRRQQARHDVEMARLSREEEKVKG